MPLKLPFSIAGCTGEDPEFPASELLYHSPDSKGWCTPRLCQYPQELMLRLEAAARLSQIQLLSHEFKIAGKMELVVGTFEGVVGAAPSGSSSAYAAAAADLSKATWRRLGFLSFDTNERSSFSARELKSVALNGVPAELLRLVIHRCHENAANVYGQVSLVAINVMGDLLAPAPLTPITNTGAQYGSSMPMGGLPHGMLPQQAPGIGLRMGMPVQQSQQYMLPPPLMQQASLPSPAGGVAALAAELGVDSVTAQRIHDLQQQKQQAVEREDYDEAKRLKRCIDRLQAAGGAIAGLEARKLLAVGEEDYDLAKQLKLEIDRMRASAYAAALSGHNDADVLSPLHSRCTSMVAPAASATSRPSDGSRSSLPGELSAAQRDAAAAETSDYAFPPTAAAAQRHSQTTNSPSGDWNSHDERPVQAKGAYSFMNADATSLPPTNRRTSATGVACAPHAAALLGKDAGPVPPGFPDLVPEPLSAADAKDAGPLVDLLGEYVARCVFSRSWQLREAALTQLAKDLEGGKMEGLDGTADDLRTITRTLLRMLKDKVAAVYSASLAALRALVAAQAGKCSQRDLQAALGELLPVLAEKASDLNQRTREQATEALVALAGVPEAGLRGATGPFLRAPKPGAAWKVVLGRLQLVSALLPVVGMAIEGSNEGFQLGALMGFVGPALSNSSADVRGAAVALTVQIARDAGPSVQRMLPADLNPKIKEQIEQGMLGVAGGPPSNKPAPAAAAHSGAAAPAASRPQQAAAPVGGRAAGRQQQTAMATTSPPAQQQPQQQASAAPSAEDDPAVYAAEVQVREARLGPTHPDVAEAISNLAIVHNQRGEAATALPLYERALAIWEVACGPESPDVAHTLTDIAVIHLEQGRDDIGRPLLQRALRIQEAHLGPEHPDVMAIRDVLLEDG